MKYIIVLLLFLILNADDQEKSFSKSLNYYEEALSVYNKGNELKAFKLFKKSCNNGLFAPGCSALGRMFYYGQGVKKDIRKAKNYYEQACTDKLDTACFSVGVLYLRGEGVRQNKKTAKEFFGKACDYGHNDGCDSYMLLNEQGY